MKTILSIILTISLQISNSFAGNIGDAIVPMSPKSFFCPECPFLIPKVPLEAPFTEITEFDIPVNLEPVVPMEATFEDGTDVADAILLDDLTPEVPATADFSEEF